MDCVRWMGDLILSKSVDNRVLLWRPLMDKERSATQASGPRFDLKGHVYLVQVSLSRARTSAEEVGAGASPGGPKAGHAPAGVLHGGRGHLVHPLLHGQAVHAAGHCGSRTGRVFAWDLMAPSDQAARAKAVMRIPSTTPCTVSHRAYTLALS